MQDKKALTIYQLNVALQGSRPLIWRRIQVPSTLTLPKLHRTLQIVMGWEECHLHEFRSGDQAYAEPDPEDRHLGRAVADERRVRLTQVFPSIGSFCEYRYDFGDNWRHDILLEAILPVMPRKRYPVCLGGAQSAPPEDVGGIGGYKRYLEALRNPKHENHDEMLAWRGRFDPERFPITTINRSLREAFPVPSRFVKQTAAAPLQTSARVPAKKKFDEIVRSLIQSSRLPQTERMPIGPDEQIPIPFSARDRELIVEHSFADSDLTERLRLDPNPGTSRIFYFTLDELDDLLGCVAAEANHAGKQAQKEWDVLYDRMAAILDGYSQSQ